MHVTSTDVIAVNGRITKGADGDAHEWASPEDWQHFKALRQAHEVLVMGRGSYESVRPKAEAGRLRVVLTHHPAEYADRAVPNQLEFVSQAPEELLQALEARGFTKVLLVGGQTNTQFFAAGLVDELFVTIEPVVFGAGRTLLDGLEADLQLRLVEVKQLNDRGTLHVHYLVDKPGTVG